MEDVDDATQIVFSGKTEVELIEDQVPKRSLEEAAQEGPLGPAPQERRVRARLSPTIGCPACSDVPHGTHTMA
eukprot:10950289-Heterocapsa_arctica.AAC.1